MESVKMLLHIKYCTEVLLCLFRFSGEKVKKSGNINIQIRKNLFIEKEKIN